MARGFGAPCSRVNKTFLIRGRVFLSLVIFEGEQVIVWKIW
ncbi:Uncharacterised protein [Candidatus Norongarragalina meridionalis]|nr:Uncharacterised protein [Candidatus Norongarragalina meridionalis]